MAGVYNIPSEYSFLKSLAAGLLRWGERDSFALAKAEVFLPTRRACIELKRSLLHQSKGQLMLLPKLSPLGDLDVDQEWLSFPQDELDLKPVIPPFKRLGLLTGLIQEYTKKTQLPSSPLLSLKLAKSLIKLMDQATIEDVSWEGLAQLVPSELAHHWQLTLSFLEIMTTHWPKIIEETGCVEPHAHHHAMVEAILKRWEHTPPSSPILAAGSTGTMPATAKFLEAVAALPQGSVILPGLDGTLTPEEIDSLDLCHPQYANTRFLKRLGLVPSEIPLWTPFEEGPDIYCSPMKIPHKKDPELRPFGAPQDDTACMCLPYLATQKLCHPEPLSKAKGTQDLFSNEASCSLSSRAQESRAALFSAALKPSFTLDKPPPDMALEGVHFVACASPQEEALAIAILLRKHLENTDQRIAFITADLKLSERVVWELKRWGLDIDSSSGDALDLSPPGVFLKLCAEFMAHPQDQVTLLSLLKHPLFRKGQPAGALRFRVRQFEKAVLRKGGAQLPEWLQEVYDLFNKKGPELAPCGAPQDDTTFMLQIKVCHPETSSANERDSGPFSPLPFAALLEKHINLAETLATDEKGLCPLWQGVKGESVALFIENMRGAASDFPTMTLQEYTEAFGELLRGQNSHFRPQKHPRLAILGPIEARLFHADVMILGGLNEGNWPPQSDVDPWLNRPMRKEMGFPLPERRIGLSAHDFGQAFSSPTVYLTRALKVDGTPTLACRWLERLEVYLKRWNLALPSSPHLLEWARELDLPEAITPISPPLPTPPATARPRRLSVTQIETWMRDPYALYARHVLALTPLDPLNPRVGPSERGTLIHLALDHFFKMADPLQNDALEILLFIGKTLFETYEHEPSVRLFWWPRFCNLAKWLIQHEISTRLPGTRTYTEVKGTLTLLTENGPFECTAKADRIDLLPDGRLRILDYKTGTPPTDQDVHLGFAPQLPLEGAIALQKGFEGIESTTLESLQFWCLKGDAQGGRVKVLSGDPHALAEASLAGLKRMVNLFENEAIPYPARPLPDKALKYNDYAHFARLQEWGNL